MQKKYNILFVEDDDSYMGIIEIELKKENILYNKFFVDSVDLIISEIEKNKIDIVIADFYLGKNTMLDLLERLNKEPVYHDIPIIIISNSTQEEVIINCLKAGAFDFISKGNIKKLPYSVIEAIKKHESIEEKNFLLFSLKQSEKKFRAIIENSNDIISIHDENGFYTFVSSACTKILGYLPSELLGKPPFDYIHKDDLEKIKEATAQVLNASNKGIPTLFRFKHSNGKWVYLETVSKNLLDDPDINGIISFTRDVTQRKLIEDKSRIFEFALKNIKEIASITDLNDRFIFVNNAFKDKYGYTEEDLIGKHVSLLWSKKNSPELTNEILVNSRLGSWKGEVINVDKNKNEFPILLFTSSVVNDLNEVIGLIGLGIDITEQKKNESDLIKAKEEAEKSSKLKDAFIANISHEIRTPLNGIVGMSSILKEFSEKKYSDEELKIFDLIEKSSKRLTRTMDMIMNISRLQIGEFSIHRFNLSVKEQIEKIIDEFLPLVKEKNLELTFIDNTKQDLELEIEFDEYCFSKSISYIIDNSIKFTEKGKIAVLLDFGDENEIIIKISDTGIGISDEFKKEIFEPFTQEEIGYNRSYEGVGLGLSIAKKMLSLNGASINVESKKGFGSCFTIIIKYNILEKNTEIPNIIKHENDKKMIRENKKVILAVEDDKASQDYLRYVLKKDYNVIFASNADIAWEILTESEISLILMDISIKGNMNGIELTKKIRNSNQYSDIPIIAITAHAFEYDRINSLIAGCNSYLSKPILRGDLVNTIEQLI